MRSDSPKKQEHLNMLIEAFREHECMSTDEMMSLLGLNRKSISIYKKMLKECGYTLEKVPGKPPKFKLSIEDNYEALTPSILRKYLIMQELQNHPIPACNLHRHFSLNETRRHCEKSNNQYLKHESDWNPSELTLIDINRTAFDELIRDMIAKNEIVLARDNKTYYLTGTTLPLVLDADYEILDEIRNQLSNISEGSPYYHPLHSVYKKINRLLDDPEKISEADEATFEKNFIVYGKKHTAIPKAADLIRRLNKLDYRNKAVRITYRTKSGNELTTTALIGMIVYSVDKDRMYLYGQESPTSEYPNAALHITFDSILEISGSNEENKHYRSPEYTRMFETMFDISSEEERNVRIEFDNLPYIKAKLDNLLKQRKKYACLSFSDDKSKIIYTDTVRGLDNFAVFIRQFGKSAYVLEPQELRDKIKNSIKLSLEQYKE